MKRHEQHPEQIDEYSIALGKLFRWLLLTLDMRVTDIKSRRELKYKLKDERKVAEEAFAERERLRSEALFTAKAVSQMIVQLFRNMISRKTTVLQR